MQNHHFGRTVLAPLQRLGIAFCATFCLASGILQAGEAPRHLDQNITLVGRVVQGMNLLSNVRLGEVPMGFFTKQNDFVPIRQVRLASSVPENERTKLELLKTDSSSFKDAVEALRNRKNDWFKVKAGYIELCNIPVMTRPAK